MRCKMRWLGCKSAPCNKRRPPGDRSALVPRYEFTNTVQIQNSRMQNAKCACNKRRFPGENAHNVQCCQRKEGHTLKHLHTSVCAIGKMQWRRSNAQYTCVSAKGAPRGEKSHVLRAPSLLHSAPEEIESVKFKDPPKKIALSQYMTHHEIFWWQPENSNGGVFWLAQRTLWW